MRALRNWRAHHARGEEQGGDPAFRDEEMGLGDRTSSFRCSKASQRSTARRRNRSIEEVGPKGSVAVKITIAEPPPLESPGLANSASDGESSHSSQDQHSPGGTRGAKSEPGRELTTDTSTPLLADRWLHKPHRATAMHARVNSSSLTNMSPAPIGGDGRLGSIPDMTHSSAGQGASNNSVFESFFDLTTERLEYIFDEFDQDEDGRVSYEALRQGLLHWAGIHISDDQHFNKLLSLLDSDCSHDISFDEFESGVRLLMMQQLFNDEPGAAEADREAAAEEEQTFPMHVVDYNALSIRRNTVASEEHMREFMFSRREGWVQCRWIDAFGGGLSTRTLKRLAVKYRLHPLALEDAITQRQRPKVDKYSTHYFFIAPLISCERVYAKVKTPARKLTSSQGSSSSRCCPGSCCGPRRAEQPEGARRAEQYGLRTKVNTVNIFICGSADAESLRSCDTLITFQREQPQSPCWDRVLRELGKSYAKVRQYDAQYLAYLILDALVDRLFPLVQDFSGAIQAQRDQLIAEEFLDLASLSAHKAELQQVLRSVRPLSRLLTHVIEDDEMCEGVSLYMRDLRDKSENVEDDLRTLTSKCETLEAEYEKLRALRSERTLYRLSVISSIFLPAQFLTGVFGMNFEYMPELHLRYSYYVFWVVTISVMIPMLIFFRCGRMS